MAIIWTMLGGVISSLVALTWVVVLLAPVVIIGILLIHVTNRTLSGILKTVKRKKYEKNLKFT